MECKFVVGQKVVCVDDYWVDDTGRCAGPKINQIVKISQLVYESRIGWVGLMLTEKFDSNPLRIYRHDCFRALNKRPEQTSIEVFKKLVTPSKTKELV